MLIIKQWLSPSKMLKQLYRTHFSDWFKTVQCVIEGVMI